MLLDRIARIVASVAVLIFAIVLVVWLIPDKPRKYLRTELMTVQEGDTFYTGFANLAVVRFRSDGQMRSLKDMRDGNRLENADGYCYRLYELSIGFPSLRAAVAEAEAGAGELDKIPHPQVLSANAIDARQGGDSVSTSGCDADDFVNPKRTREQRLAALQQELIDNGQWNSQSEHGQRVLVTFSARLADLRKQAAEKKIASLTQRSAALRVVSDPKALGEWSSETRKSLDEDKQPSATAAALHRAESASAALGAGNLDNTKREISAALERDIGAQRTELAQAGGYLGALKLTFGTVGIFTQDKRWLWIKRSEFYVRQDLAEATYGTDFARHVAMSKGGFFSPRRLVISVPEPRLLALDRYSTLQVTKGANPFTLKDDKNGTDVEIAMRADLEKFMEKMTPQAIRFAKSALTAQMISLAGEDVSEVEVRFVRDDSDEPSQLAQLISDLQRQRREEDAKKNR